MKEKKQETVALCNYIKKKTQKVIITQKHTLHKNFHKSLSITNNL